HIDGELHVRGRVSRIHERQQQSGQEPVSEPPSRHWGTPASARTWRGNSSSGSGVRTGSPRSVPATPSSGGTGVTTGLPPARETRYTPWLSPYGILRDGASPLPQSS